jgi:hypothetical protein
VNAPIPARRARRTSPAAVAVMAGTMLALLGFIFLSAPLVGQMSLGKFWSVAGLLTVIVVIAIVGLVVVGHQPHNPVGWLLCGEAMFILLSIAAGAGASLLYTHGHQGLPVAGPAVLVLSQMFNYSLAGFPVVILLFPDGRLPSRRWRWALGAYLAVVAAAALATVIATAVIAAQHHAVLNGIGNLTSLGRGSTAWVVPVQTVFFVTTAGFWLAAVGRQALTWRSSTGERRQQLKWLASGAAACGIFGIWAVATNSALWEVLILGFAALPLSIGVGILKYRLYEIDRIISRTLAYAIVTGLLVGVYAGLVLLATRVLTVHTPVAVAAATLAAAALFAPLRRRVQRVVDRRFNRARYNADRTVAAFSARLQGAVELETVKTDLASAVQAALEPAHVSVWVASARR